MASNEGHWLQLELCRIPAVAQTDETPLREWSNFAVLAALNLARLDAFYLIPKRAMLHVQLCTVYLALLISSASSDVATSLRNVWIASGGSTDKFMKGNPCDNTDFIGVTCTNGIVTQIVWSSGVSRSGSGYISPSIGDLTNLTYVNMVFIGLTGSLPPTLNLLTKLQTLDVSQNYLTGGIPNLSATMLSSLSLTNNLMNGTIPSTLPNTLAILDVGNLSVLLNYPNLVSLQLNGNTFEGAFPSTIFWKLSKLYFLDASGNQLNGFTANPNNPTPATWMNKLYLGHNPLGSLPVWFDQLTGLTTLELSYCNIVSLPKSLKNIDTLIVPGNLLAVDLDSVIQLLTPSIIIYIDLSQNLLTGPLPNMSTFSSVSIFNVAFNHLNGSLQMLTDLPKTTIFNASYAFLGSKEVRTIPSDIRWMSSSSKIDLSGCNLTSVLPKNFSSIVYLAGLYLRDNQLTGDLTSISNLTSLQYLDLSYNSLSGNLSSIMRLTNLRTLILDSAFQGSTDSRTLPGIHWVDTLSLSNCNLVSGIPSSIANSYMSHLDLSDNRLSGSIPSLLETLPYLNYLDLSNNLFSSIDVGAFSSSSQYRTCKVRGNLLPCYISDVPNCDVDRSKCDANDILRQLYNNTIQLTVGQGANLFSSLGQNVQIPAIVSAVASNLLTRNPDFSINTTDVLIQTKTVLNVSHTMSLSLEISLVLSNVAFNPFIGEDSRSTLGKVVGLSIYNATGSLMEVENLSETINITIGPTSNVDLSSWSPEGCTLYVNQTQYAICRCIHLTNFTIGVFSKPAASDVVPSNSVDKAPSNSIVIIACVVAGSVFILVIAAMVVFFVRRNKREKRADFIDMVAMNDEEGSSMKGRLRLMDMQYEEGGIQYWRAECDGINVVTVKRYRRDPKSVQSLMREASVLKSLHHPEVELYLGQDVSEGHLVTEWMNERNLYHYMKTHGKLTLTRGSGDCVAKGLNYIGQQGIVHTRILLSVCDDEAVAKIGNIGSCVQEGEKASKHTIGPHTAPEVVDGQAYNATSDVYSFGLLLWTVLFGEEVSHQMRSSMLKNNTTVDVKGDVDTMMKAMIMECTQSSPHDRPQFRDIAKKLSQRRNMMPSPHNRELPHDHNHKPQNNDSYGFEEMG
ncbi:LRR receptor-like serine/threonine-protein kinase [Planoprotostelium fungivorum]|uniref:LRR receptor-like serine/threonine-protein kinase n=1 Tax=Planoprotostelium fungivorum TaxID=1890364 RepID=A0A2P6N8D1_9EUKA|nr:LRR receptor-like serine/threonine-protein kinase [Planoprotostelium fungivorum]